MEKSILSISNIIRSGYDKLYRFVNPETPDNETSFEETLWFGGLPAGWLILLTTVDKAFPVINSIENSNSELGYTLRFLYLYNTLLPTGLMVMGKYTGRALDKKVFPFLEKNVFPKIGKGYEKIRDFFSVPDLRNLESPLYKI